MASDYRPLSPERELGRGTSPSELDFMYDKATIDQATIFIEDAIKYRSIYHKVDEKSLRVYRFYYSKWTQLFIHFVVFVIHMLAFFETPSSLTWSSDLRKPQTRWQAPCGVLESIELLCLAVLLADQLIKSYFIGWNRVKKSYWVITAYILCILSMLDVFVSLSLGCGEVIRVRRMVRPFFVIQRSTMMKKVWNCLRRTVPEIASVLLLLMAHLYFFTLFGMLLFPTPRLPATPISPLSPNSFSLLSANGSGEDPGNSTQPKEDDYFRSFNTSLISLLVLLTTANNPDVMMPAYSRNRLYALYFIVFLIIGLYCLMNMLTAVIYNQFRGYFKASMTSSLFRRRLGIRAGYEMLRHRQLKMDRLNVSVPIQTDDGGVPKQAVVASIPKLRISENSKQQLKSAFSICPDYISSSQLQEVFDSYERRRSIRRQHSVEIPWLPENTIKYRVQKIVVHDYFNYLGCFVVICNIAAISVLFSTQYDQALGSVHSSIHTMNLGFCLYYTLEKLLLIWANGWRRFVNSKLDVFDTLILVLVVVLQVIFLALFPDAVVPSHTKPHSHITDTTLWQLVKTINLLIILRLIRILPQIKTMYLVLVSMMDIARNLAPFGGLLLALYYLFAILGMELFEGVISAPNSTTADPSAGPQITGYGCGTYEQLQYWANNFDDFAASLVVLWNIMVVNNWHIFLQVYSEKVSPWSQIYFVVFWLLSVIVSVNLFTAIILENFIMRWDRHHNQARELRDRSVSEDSTTTTFSTTNPLSVHEMFRHDIEEPSEEQLIAELHHHEHVRFTDI